MKFTIGICTDGSVPGRVQKVIQAYQSELKDDYEILVICNSSFGLDMKNVRWIPFDETTRHSWITKKKNVITFEAKYDNIVYTHDYLIPLPGWYAGWHQFSRDYDIAMNKVLTYEGTRHSDWVVDSYLMWEMLPDTKDNYDVLLPYNYRGLTKIQYISGGYWVAKKQFMQQHPLNENLVWGQAEDIEWSRRIRQETTFRMNTNSAVQIMKPNKWSPNIIDHSALQVMMNKHNLQLVIEEHTNG